MRSDGMNLLIVDDEVIAIQGILDSVDWRKLEFENVFTANSYAQALNLFVKEQIHVMLCDIEMPYGSGLDLVEWVKKEYKDTECIFLTCHDEFDFARQAISLKCLDYILKPATPERIEQVLGKALETVKARQRDEKYKKFGKIYVDELSRKHREERPDQDVVERVEEYIHLHIADNLTVDELAGIVFLSPDYLTRLFKRKKNMTIIDYITEQRMFLAKELLEKDEMSISMISAKVGYGNYSYFTRIFKKCCGVTPSEYQRNLRKNSRKRAEKERK